MTARPRPSPPHSGSPVHLFSLPIDLVLLILAAVPTHDLVRLRRTNKLLHKIVDLSPCLWRKVGVKFDANWAHWRQVESTLSKHAKDIRKLALSNVRDDVLNCCWPLAQELESLELNGWNTLSAHAFGRLHELPQLSFPKLRAFTLTEYSSSYCAIGSSSLLRLVECAPNLEHLHVWCNLQLDPFYMRQLPTLCPKLRSLSLSSMQWHCDADIYAIVSGLPCLTYLAISHAGRLTDSGLAQIAAAMPRLCTLVVHGAPSITGASIRQAATGCKWLGTIKIYDCPHVDLGTLQELGYDSVFLTPAVKHRPCFRSLGLGFVRKVPPLPRMSSSTLSALASFLASASPADADSALATTTVPEASELAVSESTESLQIPA